MDEKQRSPSSPGIRFSNVESDKARPTRPRISERPLSSAWSSSAFHDERRRSLASLRLNAHAHKKPRSGDRLFAAYRDLPLALKGAVIILATAAPLAVFTGLAYTQYRGRYVGNGELHVIF